MTLYFYGEHGYFRRVINVIRFFEMPNHTANVIVKNGSREDKITVKGYTAFGSINE